MKSMLRSILNKTSALCIAALISVAAFALPQKPVPERLVNDLAGIFTPAERIRLEQALVAFDDSTSNQIAVITVSDLEGYAPSDYATRIGLDWKIGSAEFNNGIVILVKPKTDSKGEVAISVGYGLEGAIPDVYAKRIIDNEMIPHFMENDYFSGVAAACQVLMQLASGEISEPRGQEGENNPAVLLIFFIISFVGLAVLLSIISKGGKGGGNDGHGGGGNSFGGPDAGDIARAVIIGNLLGSSRGGRSSGGFGGGFGGFGGFGGGSFGGGGASGSW